MNCIFQDSAKIKTFANIQKKLIALKKDSTNKEINNFINQIPESMLTQKDDLMTLCQIIGYSIRNRIQSKKIVIKIIDQLMNYMKTYLSDESSFLWNIFGGHFYFKLLMYEKGLISIRDIILNAQYDSSYYTSEYFSPEIYENEPEIYDKEIKYKTRKQYSEKEIFDFKKLRTKHCKWLRESCDYKDPKYREIETNPLRLALKIDDIDSFQKIISNNNISIDSVIDESVLDNDKRIQSESRILEYAIKCNSIKIFKFLILNDVQIYDDIIYDIFETHNYDFIHCIEKVIYETFSKQSLTFSIQSWYSEYVDYCIDNYNSYGLCDENEIINSENDKNIISIISSSIFSMNFIFFESYLLPFLQRNQRFVSSNIHEIIYETFYDWSCFFLNEFIKYPKVNINHVFKDYDNTTLFSKSILGLNVKAAEIISNHPDFVPQTPCFKSFSALEMVSKLSVDPKFIKIVSKQSNFNVNHENPRFHIRAIELAVSNGNIYSTQFLFDNYPNLNVIFNEAIAFYCLKTNHLYTLKMLLKFSLDKKIIKKTRDQMVDKMIEVFSSDPEYRNDFGDIFRNIYNEAKIMITSPSEILRKKSIRVNLRKTNDHNPKKVKPIIVRPNLKRK